MYVQLRLSNPEHALNASETFFSSAEVIGHIRRLPVMPF